MFVSVIIPTHNRPGATCRAVDSVLHQSHADFELIVVDDGSTDDTLRWLNSFSDPRMQVMPVSHGGVARARNIGVNLAHADWICLLDSDDLWWRHKLREQIVYHQQQPEYRISQTDDMWIRRGRFLNKHQKHLPFAGDLFAASLERCMISSSSVMLHRSLLDEAGGWDESLPVCEDYDMWLRITARHPVGFVDKVLSTKFGGHADQLSQRFAVMDQYRIRALTKILQSDILSPVQQSLAIAERERKEKIVKKVW